MLEKLAFFLNANPFLEMVLQMMPPAVATALREVRAALGAIQPGMPELVVREPVDGRSLSGVGACLADLVTGTAQAGNLFRGTVRGGSLRAWNVVIGDVLGGDVTAVNVLVGAVRGGTVKAVNAIVGDIHGGELHAIGLVVGDVHGGILHGGVLVGDVHGGEVVVQQHLGKRIGPSGPVPPAGPSNAGPAEGSSPPTG
jgi:hypothetical protein